MLMQGEMISPVPLTGCFASSPRVFSGNMPCITRVTGYRVTDVILEAIRNQVIIQINALKNKLFRFRCQLA